MKQILVWFICSVFLYSQEVSDVKPTDFINVVEHNQSEEKIKSFKEDEKMRLMYQVFTYSSDLDNAYNVAKKAVEKHPNSLYWHGKAAEISEWQGKSSEAMKHYMFMYSKTYDEALEKRIIKYGLEAYQYETVAPMLMKKAMKHPTKINIDNMVAIYDKTGSPEIAAKALEDLFKKGTTDTIWLNKALSIYIDLADNEAIERVIGMIKKNNIVDYETAQNISNYYLSIHKINDSYKILLQVNKKVLEDNEVKYYSQMSDIGWYLQDFENAAAASKKLYLLGYERLVDYERIIHFYSKKDPKLVANATLDGYKKFSQNYLYITYLNILFEQKEYTKLEKAFKSIDGTEQAKELNENVHFWLMKAHMYGALDQKENALISLNHAMEIEPNSISITTAVLWFFIDNKDHINLKKMIFNIEEKNQINPELWLPLAVGHFSLQQSDRAMWYIKGLLNVDKPDIDIKFMYAYIMQVREETNTFMQTMSEIYEILQLEKDKNPKLMQDKVFLERYLKAGMYFIDVDNFELLLENSKKILDKRHYVEISIFWALRHNAHERASYLSNELKEIEPWMELNIALTNDTRTGMLDTLERHLAILPIRDRVVAATRTGNMALAHTLAFDGLENNSHDYLLYHQMRQLIQANADFLKIKTGYLNRSSIEQNYFDFTNMYDVARGWSITTDLFYAKNNNIDVNNLQNIPDEDKRFDIGVRKKFDKGYIDFSVGIRSSFETYSNFSIFGYYQPISKFTLEGGYSNSERAEETVYLLLGGKKDEMKAKVSFQYLPSSNISLFVKYDRFYSQDDVYLGDGYSSRIEWYQQIRSGYPDIAWGVFSEFGNYSENNGSKGVIDTLQPFTGTALPESFYNVGMNFFYGVMNKEQYTRVWRPYFEFSPHYSSLFKQTNIAFSAGYGGHIFDKDHMIFGAVYDQAVNGTQDSSFNLFMKYYMLY